MGSFVLDEVPPLFDVPERGTLHITFKLKDLSHQKEIKLCNNYGVKRKLTAFQLQVLLQSKEFEKSV